MHDIAQTETNSSTAISTFKTSHDNISKADDAEPRVKLLDLPAEVLSQIASYLPLNSQIKFVGIHTKLLTLARSSYSPIPESIQHILDSQIPYPKLFARLPSLTLYTPQDDGRAFLDVLVRARPAWILENLEFGRWTDQFWKEAYERRFLRSWRRFKREDDSWRAVFLRMLGRLEHRAVGCTHHENWTQFMTLHRNGSASINRIYSRTFDPYEIYDEFKQQNNFASQPTHVRVVLHLQDVRILAIGVLYPEPSIFVNPNAHLVLHPPLLRGILSTTAYDHLPSNKEKERATTPAVMVPSRIPIAATSPSNNTNEAYFPLVRSISPSGPAHTAYGLGESSVAPLSPSSPSLLSTFARVLPGRSRRSSSNASEAEERGGIFRVKSRETREVEWEGRKRTWSFNRPRQSSSSQGVTGGASGGMNDTSHHQMPNRPITPSMPPLMETSPHDSFPHPPTPPRTPSPDLRGRRRSHMPYQTLKTPQPHKAFKNYPNYTSLSGQKFEDPEGNPIRGDRRVLHEETEDEGLSHLWQTAESSWSDGIKMAEWDPVHHCYKRWVGPMLLVAQVHPPDQNRALPVGADGAVEGDAPDLGHPGMYASLGYEDLEDLFPWIELKGSGTGGKSRRSGLGFE